MRKCWFIFLLVTGLPVLAQEQESELSSVSEQQLENQTEQEEMETEDDTYWQLLEYYRKHPLNLNTATEADLQELQLLSAMQVASFFRYKKLLGKLLSVYELQAIPGLDITTIHKLLPFITVNNHENMLLNVQKRLQGGEQSLFIRFATVPERSKGFNKEAAGSRYLGSRSKLLFRYRYNYKNLLQYGITGDKDAGEPFFKAPRSTGFDFYSFHVFARRLGIIQSLAVGDFTVNLGQGLLQWQSLAFKKSAAVLSVKRQSAELRPYTAAGEFNFFRGAGITLHYKNWQTTLFGSLRKLSANLVIDSLQLPAATISSLLTSGYHRTASELEDRNNLQHIAAGGAIHYKQGNWQVGWNIIHHHFSKPFAVSEAPYDAFSITGTNWSNYSMDYSYTFRNLHLFGEAAMDKKGNGAFIQGLLISADPSVDITLLHRRISSAYQSLLGNAFTENSFPVNESGWYTGISVRPATGWKIDAYADFFRFPWLKYRVDAPSEGRDYMVQVTYTPSRQIELYTRLRSKTKTINLSNTNMSVHIPVLLPKTNWRTHISYQLNSDILLRNRVELCWYGKESVNNYETGFLWLGDMQYKPRLKNYSVAVRLVYFETGGYNSRIYAYENSGLYSFSIPAFFNKGLRYFINYNYRISLKWLGKSRCRAGVFWGRSVYSELDTIGSGLDEIAGKRKSDIKIQILINFQ